MLSDGKRAQLSDNLLPNEALFETSINGRETLYEEEEKTPETPEKSEWTETSINGRETLYEEEETSETPEKSEWRGIMSNYRRDPPLELTEEQ